MSRSNRVLLAITLLFCSLSSSAEDKAGPIFDYGHGESHFKWGVEVPITNEASDFKLRLGTRLQGVAENTDVDALAGGSGKTTQDFYIRRARLQVEAKFQKDYSFYMDMRAEKVDLGNDKGNGFALGDAFFQVKNVFGSKHWRARFFRAKYDISRTQTVSSSRLLVFRRPGITDFASQFISHDRRGNNAQLLFDWKKKIQGQIIAGDSVHEDKLYDSTGKTNGVKLNSQNFAYGARIRLSPFNGWEDTGMKETQFGQGRHFTIGAGHYAVSKVNFTAQGQEGEVDRTLDNFELSAHCGSLSLMGEYFMFDGIIDDHSTAGFVEGKSEGWFAQAEYVLTNFHYIAPFVRYGQWDRFKARNDFDEETLMAGLNYYMKGNKLRTGVFFEQTKYGDGFAAVKGADSTTNIGMYLMMHY